MHARDEKSASHIPKQLENRASDANVKKITFDLMFRFENMLQWNLDLMNLSIAKSSLCDNERYSPARSQSLKCME